MHAPGKSFQEKQLYRQILLRAIIRNYVVEKFPFAAIRIEL